MNTAFVPGREIGEALGLCFGSTVRAKWFANDIIASLRNIIGGEVTEYTDMLSEARVQAIERLIEHAGGMGADAVINLRFETSQIALRNAEIFAYGTAVKFR